MKVRQMSDKAAKKTGKSSEPENAKSGNDFSSTIDDVQQLIQLMIDNALGELDVKEGDRRIHLKRAPSSAASAPEPESLDDKLAPARQVEQAEGPDGAAGSGLIDIPSPMVGTFYTASSPDSDPFVAAGDVVGEDDVVCIIEAMKVMNEIRAECAGVIAEICVKNSQPVEFGQALFRVKRA